ncbi:hypothetical protein [Rubrivirga sp.]|uniref:hypothetical protein n=1 Tax=Rubrivirga sp. TaxID=1885344 RepID=UPI003C7150E2
MSESSVSVSTPRGLVTITSRSDRSRAVQRRAASHQTFLSDHWAELSAAAYEGYRRHGAGAVVLWRSDPPRRFRPRPFEPERLFYTTQIHNLPGTTEADFEGWEAHQLETYDPEAEGLVVFVEGGGVVGYRVAGQPPPPIALAASKARHN